MSEGVVEIAYYQYQELERVLGSLCRYVDLEGPQGFYTRCLLVNGTVIKPTFEKDESK